MQLGTNYTYIQGANMVDIILFRTFASQVSELIHILVFLQ